MSRDIPNRQSALSTPTKTPAHNVQKWLRHVRGQNRNPSLRVEPGQTLRQDFSQRHAQRPDVPAGRSPISHRLRRIVSAGFSQIGEGPARPHAVTRKFELVAGSHYVGRFYAPVNISLAVKEAERLQRRIEHGAGFFSCEPALRYDLRQVLFRVLHHREDKVSGIQAAASGLEYPDQMRMRHFLRQLPALELA